MWNNQKSSSEALRCDALHIEADTIQWHLQTIEDLHHQKTIGDCLIKHPSILLRSASEVGLLCFVER